MELPQCPGRGPERVQGEGSLAYSDAAVLRHGQAPGEARQVPQGETAHPNGTLERNCLQTRTGTNGALVLKNGYMIDGFESMSRMG